MILLRCLFALTSAQRRESPSGRYKWKFRFLRSLGYIGASRANRPRRFIGRIYTYVERSLSFFRLLFRTFSVPANSLHDGEQEDEAPVNESVQSLGAQSHHASSTRHSIQRKRERGIENFESESRTRSFESDVTFPMIVSS